MHIIEAIVAQAPIDSAAAATYELTCFEHEGFAIIALDDSHAAHWAEKLGLDDSPGAANRLDRPVIHFFAQQLGLGRYALIATAYVGGIGTQYGAVYENGRPLMPETEGGINAALKLIGVVPRGDADEFDTISLGRYRSFHRYYLDYGSAG